MPSTNKDILDAMESVAREASVDLLQQTGMAALAQVSSAISLKRIADVLEAEGGKSHFEKVFGR